MHRHTCSISQSGEISLQGTGYELGRPIFPDFFPHTLSHVHFSQRESSEDEILHFLSISVRLSLRLSYSQPGSSAIHRPPCLVMLLSTYVGRTLPHHGQSLRPLGSGWSENTLLSSLLGDERRKTGRVTRHNKRQPLITDAVRKKKSAANILLRDKLTDTWAQSYICKNISLLYSGVCAGCQTSTYW